MRKALFSFVSIMLLIFLSSCALQEAGMYGDVTVVFDSSTRAIDSNISMKTESYKITFSGPNGENISSTADRDATTISRKGLATGEWTITVEAVNKDSVVIGSGSAEVEIKKGTTATANITVTELEGDGTLSVTIYGDNPNSSTYTLEVYRNDNGSDTLVKSQAFSTTGSVLQAEVTLPNGFYIIKVTSSTESEQCPVPEAVRIVRGDKVSASYTITEGEGSVSITVNNLVSRSPELSLLFSSSFPHAGDSVTVTANGMEDGSCKYEWYLDGTKKTGDTSSITLDSLASVGDYVVTCIVRDTDSTLTWSVSKVLTVYDASYKPQTITVSGETEFYIVSDVVIPQDIRVGIYKKATDTLIGSCSPHFLTNTAASEEVYAKVTNKEGYSVYFEEKYISSKDRTLVYVVIDKPMDTYGTLEIKSGINDELDAYYEYYCWQSIADGYVPLPIYNDSRKIKVAPGTYSVNWNSQKWNYNHVTVRATYDKNTVEIKEGETTALTVSIPYGTFVLKNPEFEKGERYSVWVRRDNINSFSYPFTAEDGEIRIAVSTSYSYDSILVWDDNSEFCNYCIVEGPVSEGSTKEVNVEFTEAAFEKYKTTIPQGRYKIDTDTNVLLRENVPASVFWKLKVGDIAVRNFCANLMNLRSGTLSSGADFYYFDLLKSGYSFSITSTSKEDDTGEYTLILFTFDKEIENAGTLVVNYDVPSEITLSDTSRAAVYVLTESSEGLAIPVKSAETKTLKVAPGTYTYNGVWSWLTDSNGNSYKAVLDPSSFTVKSGETTTVTVKFEKY